VDVDDVIFTRTERDPDCMVNRHWKDVSIVVVGMLPDQVHPPGRADNPFGFGIKMEFEGLLEFSRI
jgi:hypothetical protein